MSNYRLNKGKRLARHLGRVLSYLRKREVGDLRQRLLKRIHMREGATHE